MKTSYLNLEKILDIQTWQKLQDSLADVTKMAIITVDYKGVPITAHSNPRPFCQYVRSQRELEKYCHKCDSRGGLEAVRMNAPYIYLCHCDIVDIAIPIIVDGKYIGATMAGQIRLPPNEQKTELEQILVSPAKNIFSIGGLLEMYADIPILPYKEIQSVAHMLFDLCNYIVAESMKKNLILEMYENVANAGTQLNTDGHGYDLDNIEQVQKAIGNVIINTYVNTTNDIKTKNPILRPALEYIFEHKGENFSQKQLADLCHISSSHFSRLFAKEVGESYSNFVSRIKVEWSKQLLEKTDYPITQISDEMGFNDPGYFIKTFKKFENITPAAYRKYYTEKQ